MPAFSLLWLATGIFSGLVDSIAGGGGLITLPVLLATGIPPHLALGTNKLQAVFGSGSATFHFASRGEIHPPDYLLGIVMTFAGAVLGALAVSQIDPELVGKLIPFLLFVILLYTILKPGLGQETKTARLRPTPFYILAGLSLGFYDGFFGPGTGSFWAMAFITGLGFNFVKATASTKLMNFTSNVAALIFFALRGSLVMAPGLLMGIGQLAGAQLGARMVLRSGARVIRPIYFAVVLLTLAKLVYHYYLS